MANEQFQMICSVIHVLQKKTFALTKVFFQILVFAKNKINSQTNVDSAYIEHMPSNW